MWTPSIYMGMLVAMVCLVRLLRWRSDGVDEWMGVAFLSILLAMGHFGFVWWVQATTGTLNSIDSAVGGPYWFVYHLLPGYDSFRYPAKWLTVFAFATAMTTASFLDQEDCCQRLRRIVMPVMITLIIASIAMWLGASAYSLIHDGPTDPLARDEFWGPLQLNAALQSITRSLVHSTVAVIVLAWFLWRQRSKGWSPENLLWSFLILLVFDSAFAARGLILSIPIAAEQALVDEYDSISGVNDRRWMRTQSEGGWPRLWAETSRQQRGLEVEASGRVAWFGRWHLTDHQPVLNNMVSIRSQNVALFWDAAVSLTKSMTLQEQREFWNAMRKWLGVGGVLHTTGRAKEVSRGEQRFHLVDRLVRFEEQPEALQVHDQWRVAESSLSTLAVFEQRLREVAEGGGDPIPVIELAGGSHLKGSHLKGQSVARDSAAGLTHFTTIRERGRGVQL